MISEDIMTAVNNNQGTGKLSGRVGIVGTGHRARVSLDAVMPFPRHQSDKKLRK